MKIFARKIIVLCLLLVSGILARNLEKISPIQSSFEKPKVLSTTESEKPEVTLDVSGPITVGAGYSGDLQQITQQQCFDASISSITEKEGEIQLDQATSFSDLENILRIQVSVGGRFFMFSAKAKANYMRSIRDKDYSMSLNYYATFSNKVTVNIAGYGVDALTKFGKGTYNDTNNPYFGLVCGDQYIASYDQGALLTMGLNIELSSHEEKREFKRKAKINIGPFNIFKAAGSVEEVCKENKITGSVTIHAFQIGGEPTKLTQILNNNVVTCNINAMAECHKTASTLLDYAKEFGNQIQNNTNFEPLGTATYHPIEWLGLTPPPSLVTPEVEHYRQDLANKLEESEFYTQKLYSFREGYPVKLDDAFIDHANSILSKADHNVRVLMDPMSGAAGCFNEPNRCKSIRDYIYSRIQNISGEDLKFLKYMKYKVPVAYGVFYNTGGETGDSWKFIPNNSGDTVSVESVYITDEYCTYVLTVSNVRIRINYNGIWDPSRKGYVGPENAIETGKNRTTEVTYTKQISPFFFEDPSLFEL